MAEVELEVFFGANLFPPRPVANRMITIEISGLVALDGTVFEGSVEAMYLTSFDPFYANSTAVRMIAGQFLNEVDDNVIDQFIWYFSKQADLRNLSPCTASRNAARYKSYRSRWVVASVVIGLLSGTTINSRMQKRLGDLSVLRDGAAQELLKNMRKELEDLTANLEDGGLFGRNIETTVKAGGHPDMPLVGRQFAPDQEYGPFDVPGANNSGIFRDERGRLESTRKKFWKGGF